MPYILDRSVSPSIIKDSVYCPVMAWIKLKYNVTDPPTDSMKEGKNVKVTGGKGQVKLTYKGATAIVDEIIKRGRYIVVTEKKRYSSRSIHQHLAQLLATTYIAAKSLGRVRTIILETGEQKREIELMSEMIEIAEEYFKRVKRYSEREEPPHTTPNPSKCRWCWYKRYCYYG
ncbi:MAG: CRISPR-associated protein Cas4 [Sulfolobales archaeon]